jgi:hypothetical protein
LLQIKLQSIPQSGTGLHNRFQEFVKALEETMKKITLVGRLAVVTLLVTLSGNLAFAYSRPNLNAAPAPNSYKKSASEAALIKQTRLKAAPEQVDFAALTEKPQVKALLNKIAGDKVLFGKVDAVMKMNLSDEKKAALLVSAFRPYTGDWFECVGTCLRSAGVGIYALIMCAATCALTAGVMCAVCLGVSVGLTELCGLLCAKEVVQMQENAN